jgi:outer membrane immunogenic protein
MKKIIAIAAAVLGTASVASAADLAPQYAKAAPVMAAPVFSWTGCYVGIHGGGGTISDSATNFEDAGRVGLPGGHGGLAGGQVGCNYQTGVWVAGIEGEGFWSGMTSRTTLISLNSGTSIDEARNKYDYSIAARFGITYERAFIYGKAGWVWGKFDFIDSDCFRCITPNLTTGSSMMNGLLVGLGVEYAFTNNLTAKLEYNYLNYGAADIAFTSCFTGAPCFADFTVSQSAQKHIFKIGLNYLFGMGKGPVVARY